MTSSLYVVEVLGNKVEFTSRDEADRYARDKINYLELTSTDVAVYSKEPEEGLFRSDYCDVCAERPAMVGEFICEECATRMSNDYCTDATDKL